MEEIKKPILTEEPVAAPEEEMKLDDARRVKVLSPGMLVFKRFIRNKLAIAGTIILIAMFLFAFVGPIFTPYKIAQQFKEEANQWQQYATVMYNTDLRYTVREGETFSPAARSALLLAISDMRKANGGELKPNGTYFEFTDNDGRIYYGMILNRDVPSYLICGTRLVGKVIMGEAQVDEADFNNDAFKAAMVEASERKGAAGKSMTYDGKQFVIDGTKVEKKFYVMDEPFALASLNIFSSLDPKADELVKKFDFCCLLEEAIVTGESSVTYDGAAYALEASDKELLVKDQAGAEVASVSEFIFGAAKNGIVLTVPFQKATQEAIVKNVEYFQYPDEDGNMVDARLHVVNANIYVETEMKADLIRIDEPPTSEHLLGLDHNGMDVLTRLMYGGRISLMVGFVVIFFETFIGVIIGGVSGYFGGWVDTMLMRLVDLFNAIPFYPMVIIMGSVMDAYRVSGYARIFFLMVVLGVLGWTGIARVTRGQILSLREQDFMVATEATGIRTSRKIFRHLIPNVMPLLIVNATMGLGGVIISEATLGFLGLGVKYPLASWGSIINQATDMYVMRTCWWIWIPAGCLIMLSVLGFNFVGDGLRDAYDPKMKR